MSNVKKFRLKSKPSREQAKRWLTTNYIKYPDLLENHISEDMFHGWRFIRAIDGNIYFANCVEAGINEDEFNYCRASMLANPLTSRGDRNE